jgi:hypothetical protein
MNTTATTFPRALLYTLLNGKANSFPLSSTRLLTACRAISRDPKIYPDPETFNPLRWLQPEYPTYQEPLTQFPTIINSSQFGYGRRTCQGQTVADEDLLIGIGSIAWMFNIEKKAQDTPSTSEKPTNQISLNEKGSISSEELNLGVVDDDSKPSYTDNEDLKPARPFPPGYKPLEWGNVSQKPADPTLDYSILLIAKPIPFQFKLKPRDKQRITIVRTLFREGVERGDFTKSREYWGPDQGRNKPLGWSKV